MNNKKKEMTTTQVIMFGFLTIIAIGTALLTLPIASATNEVTSVVDALFTSTTSVCVTGLVVVNTFEHWSIFGQVVILLLIQCGGLGVVALTTSFVLIIGRKVSLKGKLLLEDAFNLKTMSGLVGFLKFVIKGTFIVEGIGALCYMLVFVPEYGARGIWISVFTAVSAFCNAGIDIIGPASLTPYVSNVWINVVTMSLIVLGGLGFIVWYDIIRVLRIKRNERISFKEMILKLNLHSKLVLVMTGLLIFGGALLIFILEYSNPATIGNLSFGDKILASFFQSVTLRTAGFLTISQKGLTEATALCSIILMFIGGSSVGTAGGVKTTTVALVILVAIAVAKGKDEVVVFNKTIPLKSIRKALAVFVFSTITLLTLTGLVMCLNGGDFLDVLYETTSAIGTVGLSRDFTPTLKTAGKNLIVCCMYLGRVGPISMAMVFNKRVENIGLAKYSKEDITVG